MSEDDEVYFEREEVDAIQGLIMTLDSKIVKANLVKQSQSYELLLG